MPEILKKYPQPPDAARRLGYPGCMRAPNKRAQAERMNLVLFHPLELDSANRLVLDGRRAEHLIRVCRVKPGKALRVGEINGRLGTGVVENVDEHRVTLRVELFDGPAATPSVHLILALPRPQMLKRIFEAAAPLGIARVDLVCTHRVEKGFLTSPVLQQPMLNAHLDLGLEQAVATARPIVELHTAFSGPLVAKICASSDPASRFVADTEGTSSLADLVDEGCTFTRPVIFIGPEGGLIDRERETLSAEGFTSISLGERILRVETAVPYMVAQIELARTLANRHNSLQRRVG